MSISVRVTTNENGTLVSDFTNGSTIDGVILDTNDIILLKNQTKGSENGCYKVNFSGYPTRMYLLDTSHANQFSVSINEGNLNAFTQWICTNTIGSDIVGKDDLIFEQTTRINPTGTKKLDVYYNPLSSITVDTNWTDIPMNVERTIDNHFTHIKDSAEITFNTSGTYLVMIRCSTNVLSGTSTSQSKMRLVENSNSDYKQIDGTIGFICNSEVTEGYNTANVNLIKRFNSNDKIKLQAIKTSGTSTIVATPEGCGITIMNL